MENIIQFGTGAFLRGFADWMFQEINDRTDFKCSVVAVQSTSRGLCDAINKNPEYTLVSRGLMDGSPIAVPYKISVLSRCVNAADNYEDFLALAENPDFKYIVSNTTEAGIAYDREDEKDKPAKSFPGKLTQLMYKRFKLNLPGFIILPCELIERNAGELLRIILLYADKWELGEDFKDWVLCENRFLNTLVDRIVTGFAPEIGDENPLTNTSELYHIWVIEGSDVGLPFEKAGINVVYTDSLDKYRTRKVRILNGAHTSLIPTALLKNTETVLDCMNDPELYTHLENCLNEIIPAMKGNQAELREYANEVIERFKNPYIRHKCRSIALNSVSKFKVRVLPSIKDYIKEFGKIPDNLYKSLLNLIEFYKTHEPTDDEYAVEFIKNHTVDEILANKKLWGEDLNLLLKGDE